MEEDEDLCMSGSPYTEEIIANNTVTYFVKTFNEFSQKLKEHEIQTKSKFVLAHSLKKFTAENVAIRENSKLRWKDDIPYYHVCTRTYTCHHGRDGNIYQKKKYAQIRDAKALTDHNFTKRYNKVQLTKKLDCPAVVNVSRIIWIPEHKLLGTLTRTFEKKKMSRMIKSKICRGEPVGEECFMFNLPDETDHMYHLVGTYSELTEPIQPEMRGCINGLVHRGEQSALIPTKLSEVSVLKTTEEQNDTPDSRGSRNKLLDTCKSTIQAIQSTMLYLDEDKLEKLSTTLGDLYSEITREVATDETTGLPIEPHIPASSSKDYGMLQMDMKQEVNERSVAADMVESSKNIKLDDNNVAESNNLKRKKKTTMILIKKRKDETQLSLFHSHLTNACSISTNQSIIIGHQRPSF